MTKLLGDWLQLLPLPSVEVSSDEKSKTKMGDEAPVNPEENLNPLETALCIHLTTVLRARYSPEAVRATLWSAVGPPTWVREVVRRPHWRRTIVELSNQVSVWDSK